MDLAKIKAIQDWPEPVNLHELVHVAGKKNVVADALSRRRHVAVVSIAYQHALDEMRDHYSTDEDFAEPYDALVRGNSYGLKDGFLMFRGKLCVSRLLRQKAQLALIQAKATAEVAQAKQLALEKEIRLKSADLALANLKRVQVEYWGEGERVELAGSFNGWKYFILMESDPTSEISRPDGSRGPMMWGAELWLYPGVYEIKFIIDGVWQIDQRREVVTKNSLHNNLLRVEP
ncbi:hypothetical protein L7F22_002522 [Adiantum nelumboides]|nr:hypothetical protein [Adiantum nelumboides]